MDQYRITRGFKKDVILLGSQNERDVTEKMSNYFGITFTKTTTFKSQDYTFAFMQPDEEMQRNYNFYNEILLLFSKFKSFDTRTFDFVDKILEEFSNRLDRLCVFIVSNDPAFTQIIRRKIESQKDFRLVVPFFIDEILSKKFDTSFLHERLRENLYTRDLFAMESPLRSDEYFYGRSMIVQKLYSKYSVGEHCGLFGLRKIGKTSVLYALERLIIQRGGKSVFIDCQNTSVHRYRWFELLQNIVTSFLDKYQLRSFFNLQPFTDKNAGELFERYIKKLYKQLSNQRLLFIFDEIENITIEISPSEHWKSGEDALFFWQTIRSVYQQNPELYSFTIAGVNPLVIERTSFHKFDNPIYSMIQPIYLEFFSHQDVKQMVSKIGGYLGLSFDEEIYTFLVEDYGGHPFLIRKVCSFINSRIKAKPYLISKYEYKQYKSEYDMQLASYVDSIVSVLKEWYPHELELLGILATKGSIKFLANVKNNHEINHLIGYGIINGTNGKYIITINAIAEYLRTIFVDAFIPDDIEGKWALISKRRNKIEIKLRQLIKIVLESNKGKATAKNTLLGYKEQSVRDKIKSTSIDEILENHFYFPDYATIIGKNWELFEKIFTDKHLFQMSIDTVNKLRVDAHAKNITDDQFFMVTYALDFLEEKLL